DAGRVADLLTEHYEVERPTALADAETWIAQLRKAELIEE
nr:PqqD family peptide modification chaperone [Tidjanibacter sp.]